MNYREQAINLLVDEIKLPIVNGEPHPDILSQYEPIISFYVAILSHNPVFPITVWSATYYHIARGIKIPRTRQPSQFSSLRIEVKSAWNDVSVVDGDGVTTMQACIVDVNNKHLYP